MAIDLKKFLGLMNSDDSENVIPAVHHALANNVRFRGTGDNLRVENVPGTTLINNHLLPSSGNNECLGAFFDPVRQLIYWFNYNSNLTHGIYIYNTQLKTIQALLVNGSATDGDILGFTLSRPIVSVNIIYDSINGDIILFVDSLKRPTGFNTLRYLNTPYPVTKRNYIDVAKAPPPMPPRCVYENDYNVTINNLNKSLYKVQERYVYDDNQKSVPSSGSEVPLPWNNPPPFVNGNGYIPDAINARIRIFVQTGDIDVKAIDILGKQITDTTIVANSNTQPTPDTFLIVSLNKAQLGIPSNAIYQFLFYNNGTYDFLPLTEATELFDYVPQQANCQELLNGSNLVYGGITEGYPNTPIDGTLTTENTFLPPHSILNGVGFVAACNGTFSGGIANQLQMYVTGVSQNDGSGNPMFLEYNGITFFVNVQKPDGTNLSFQFTSTTFVIADILAGLAAAAVVQGFTVVSTGTNSLVVSYPTNVALASSRISLTAIPANSTNDTIAAYATRCAYNFGIQYYDGKYRTNGTNPFVGNPLTTLEDLTGTLMPSIDVTIRSRPPTWARYWQLVRSNNLTYNERLFWVCNQTFTNTDQNTGEKYAYIGISNMPEYDKDIEASTPVVHYDFAPGDRIRFEIRYPVGAAPSILSSNLDYDIISTEEDPIINGVMQTGNFIKIVYPSNISGNFDFGGGAFQNYKILIYSYAPITSANNTVYYEFGKCFGIGNAGTATAFHLCSTQSQSADLSVPATMTTVDGDFFFRQRIPPAGMIYYPTVSTNPYVDTFNMLGVTFDNSPITTPSYIITNQTAGPFTGGLPTAIFQNLSSVTQRLRITSLDKFTMQVGANKTSTVTIGVSTSPPVITDANLQYLLRNLYMGIGENVQTYDATLDGFANVGSFGSSNEEAWVILENKNAGGGASVRNGSFILKFQVLNDIPINIIESSFSDQLQIVTNSNSRPSLYDPNAAQNYYPNLLRWGLAYQQGTNLNNINRFYFTNQAYLSLDGGDIQRMKARDRIIRFFQNRRCCEMNIFNTTIKTGSGTDILSTTENILTPNNVKYYEGEYGIGTNFTGLISGKIQDYFVDPIRNYLMRLSNDGLIPISELYKGQFYIASLIAPYGAGGYIRPDGAPAFMFGYYDYLEEEAHFLLQGGTNGSSTISSYNFSFNERRNAFTSFFDANPEWITSAEQNVYSWLNGQLYIHNNQSSGGWSNYYGTDYFPSITMIYNDKNAVKKTFETMGYQANQFWVAAAVGDIITSQINEQTGLPQISQLIIQDFDEQEYLKYAAFKRDANSMQNPILAINEGDILKGTWIKIKLTYQGNDFAYLYTPYVKWNPSSKNF